MASLTLTDIRTRVMNALRISTTNTAEETKVIALINSIYRDIYAKEDWWWAIKRQVINTLDDSKGTATSITNSSTSVTLSTAPTPSLTGYRFLVDGDQDYAAYIVNSHTSGTTALTLDSFYNGVTSTSASFTATRDTYSLATDTNKVLVVRRYGRDIPLRRVGIDDMLKLKNNSRLMGKPEAYTIQDFATSGDPTSARQLVVHPYPDDTYRLEITYKQALNTELSGTTQPFIPDDYRETLYYGALARGYPIFLNDTERGAFFQGLFNDLMNLMQAAQREYTRDFPGVAPFDTYRRARRPRTSGGYTLGGLFDRLPFNP